MSVDTSLSPLPDVSFGRAQARHLLRRVVFGADESTVTATQALGPREAINTLLAQLDGDDYWPKSQVDPDVIYPPTLAQRRASAQARRDNDVQKIHELRSLMLAARRDDQRMIERMRHDWLNRLIASTTAVRENLVLLWHDHFATRHHDIRDAYLIYQQHELFRNAPDRFDVLARAIVRDPAMLRFLNNNSNNKRKPNENLARELMELFTLGVGHYTEADVKQGARALTGYHVSDNDFKFRYPAYDTGEKIILGQTGDFNGDAFVGLLLLHRQCPHFVAMKLYDHFVLDVADNPEQMPRTSRIVIEQLAALVRQHGYHLRPVLRILLASRHFHDSAIVGRKVKSPAHLIAGTARSLNVSPRDEQVLARAMQMMGQVLFDPPSVAGWAGGSAWINTSTLFVRQNAAIYLITGQNPARKNWHRGSFDYDPMPLLDGINHQTPAAVADHCVNLLLGEHIPSARRAPLVAFINSRSAGVDRRSVTALLLLITSMPEYQLT